MMAMLQRLDARRFFFRSELSVGSFLALLIKVLCNGLRCHGCSVAERSRPNLCCFGHSATIMTALDGTLPVENGDGGRLKLR